MNMLTTIAVAPAFREQRFKPFDKRIAGYPALELQTASCSYRSFFARDCLLVVFTKDFAIQLLKASFGYRRRFFAFRPRLIGNTGQEQCRAANRDSPACNGKSFSSLRRR
jgi:hypothetical protein